MSISLVTGYYGEPHVTAKEVASFNKSILGGIDGQGVVFNRGNAFSAEMVNANTCRIHGGDLVLQGRHVHMDDTDYEDVTIDTGATGWNRYDLIVVHYTRDGETGEESAELQVIKGTPVTGEPSTPRYTNADIDVELETQLPLWRIRLDGITPRIHARMTKLYEPLVSKTDLFNHIYPVGSIYMSVNNVNPSTLFGGTWVAWGSGRVPTGVNTSDTQFNTVEKTGGAKTNTITVAQMPAHTHTYAKSAATTGSTALTANQIPAHNHSYTSTSVETHTGRANNTSVVEGVPHSGFQTLVSNFNDLLSTALQTLQDAARARSFTMPVFSLPAATKFTDYTHTHILGVQSTARSTGNTGGGAGHTHTVSTSSAATGSTGGGSPHSILQPYITCYMWKRTA